MTEETGTAPDPTRIRSVAVHREDVTSALEATLRSDRAVVLRMTPPYSGRMRARIHRVGAADDCTGAADDRSGVADGSLHAPDGSIHLDPRELVEELPTYPEVDETAAEHPDSDLDARHERHGEAVEAWRERIRQLVGGTVTLPVADEHGRSADGDAETAEDGSGTHAIDVLALG